MTVMSVHVVVDSTSFLHDRYFFFVCVVIRHTKYQVRNFQGFFVRIVEKLRLFCQAKLTFNIIIAYTTGLGMHMHSIKIRANDIWISICNDIVNDHN